MYTLAHTPSTHFKKVDLTVRVVVILQSIEGVVMSVTVDSTDSWTWWIATIEVATMTHTEETGRCTREKQEEGRGKTTQY